MYNSDGWKKMGGVDDQQGALEGMSDFFTKRLCMNFREDSNLGSKANSGGRNIEVAVWELNNRDFY